MKKITKIIFYLFFFLISLLTTTGSEITNAQPYGSGSYNSNLPYGGQTSLSISTDGDINIPITPTEDGVISTGTSKITVISTDTAGYKLYIKALNTTDMTNNGATLSASNNESYAPLEVNTWGYNIDNSNNYIGIKLSDSLIRSSNYLALNGEDTNVTYGVYINMAKPAGNYISDVVYTAVPQTY